MSMSDHEYKRVTDLLGKLMSTGQLTIQEKCELYAWMRAPGKEPIDAVVERAKMLIGLESMARSLKKADSAIDILKDFRNQMSTLLVVNDSLDAIDVYKSLVDSMENCGVK